MARGDHAIYTAEDFTKEEKDRGNILFNYVVLMGCSMCKQCGAKGWELNGPCGIKAQREWKESLYGNTLTKEG